MVEQDTARLYQYLCDYTLHLSNSDRDSDMIRPFKDNLATIMLAGPVNCGYTGRIPCYLPVGDDNHVSQRLELNILCEIVF